MCALSSGGLGWGYKTLPIFYFSTKYYHLLPVIHSLKKFTRIHHQLIQLSAKFVEMSHPTMTKISFKKFLDPDPDPDDF